MKLPISVAVISLSLSFVGVRAQTNSAGTNNVIYEAQTFNTLTGQPGVAGFVDGDFSTAQFAIPVGIVGDGKGSYYVGDSNNNAIRKVDRSGKVTTIVNTAGVSGFVDGPGATARMWLPAAVAMAADGSLLVLDGGTNRAIRRVTLGTNVVVSTLFSTNTWAPGAIAVDKNGNAFVTDRAIGGVWRVTPGGTGEIYARNVQDPSGICVDGNGGVYTSDFGTHVIRKVSSPTSTIIIAGRPYVAGNNDGDALTATFQNPSGLAMDAAGNIFVCDTGNSTIRKITPGGVVRTLAGFPGLPDSANGTGSGVRFRNPVGLFADIDGAIFVADTHNDTIRQSVVTNFPVHFSAVAYTAAENAQTLFMPVALGRVYAQTVTVNFATSDGSATNHAIAGIDYVATNGTLTFLPGQMTNFINIQILNNTRIDGNRSFRVALSNAVGASLDGLSEAVVTIADNDSAIIAPDSLTVSENAGSYQFRIVRTGELDSIRVVTSDGPGGDTNHPPARAGIDYVAVDQSLSFQSGETIKAFSIPIINNTVADGSRRFTIALFAGANRVSAISVDILDNDFVTVGPNAPSVAENAGFYQVRIQGGESGQVRVVTSDGPASGSRASARAGIDYTAVDQIVAFTPGEFAKYVPIPIINNAIADGMRAFSVAVYNGDVRISNASVDILDNDGVALPANNSTVREDTALYQFHVQALGELTQVRIATADGDPGNNPARAGFDYVAVDQIVNFAPGDGAKTVPITILNNKILDGTRTFNVNAYSSNRLVASMPVSILDNDGINLIGPYEVFENEGTLKFVVEKTGDLESFTYVTTDGPGLQYSWLKPAIAGVDYKFQLGSVTFAPGQTNAVVSIPIIDNGAVDKNRTFTLNFLNSGELTPALITIHDNELNAGEDLEFAFNVQMLFGGLGGWGSIQAITPQRDGKILIGGLFTVGNGENIARLNADGTLDESFVATVSIFDQPGVAAIRLMENGKIVIAGSFDQVNGFYAPGIARLNSDGSLDTNFFKFQGAALTPDFGAPAQINDILVDPNGAIYVGGQFDSINGVARTNIARLRADGSVDLTFKAGTDQSFDFYNFGAVDPEPRLSSVNALAFWSGGVVIGGRFSAVDGLPRNSTAWLDESGSAMTDGFFLGDGVENGDNPGLVTQILPLGDDSMVMAGNFTSVHGVGRQNIARLRYDGTLDFSYNLPLGNNSPVLLAKPITQEFVYELDWRPCDFMGIPALGGGARGGCGETVRKLDPYNGFTYSEFSPDYVPYARAAAAEDSGHLLAGGYGNLHRYFATSDEPRVGFQSTYEGAFISEVSAPENEVATFTIERRGDTGAELTLDYATTNGTARAGLNYAETKGRLTFAPMEIYKTITVPLLHDGALADGLTFGLRLRNPNSCCWNATLLLDEATGYIQNIDLGFTDPRAGAFSFSTLAGRAGQSGSSDGIGGNARFWFPWAIATDASNNLFVSDRLNHTVRKITPDGTVSTYAGQPGLSAAPGFSDGFRTAVRFTNPGGIVFDSQGNIFVTSDYTIRKITPAGQVSIFAGALQSGYLDGVGTAARFSSPIGLGIDAADTLYTFDSLNAVIRKISPQGVVTTLAGHAGQAGTVDGKGPSALLSQGGGLAVTREGVVYFTEQYTHLVRRITPDGTVTTIAGKAWNQGHVDGFGANAQFATPVGIALDPSGNLIVADQASHCIRRVTPAGEVTTIAGVPWAWGSIDAVSISTRFYNPNGVAFDSAGAMYVADGANNTIRKGITSFGFTLAGASGQVAVLEASTDLRNWQPISTNSWDRIAGFADLQSQNYSNRFYRLRKP